MLKYLLLACTLAPGLVLAKPTTYQQHVLQAAPYPAEAMNYRWTTPTQVKEGKARFGSIKRNPSNQSAPDESSLSPAFRRERDRFLQLKTSDELEAFLTSLENNYATMTDDDLRFFAAHVLPIRQLRGIVWRATPVYSRAKIAHSYVLTAIKSASASMRILLPTDQWEAGFDYITKPYVRDGQLSTQFQTEADLMAYLAGSYRNSLAVAAHRIQAIDLKDKTLTWDNKLWFGKATFTDDLDRYRLVGEVERLTSLANFHGALAQLTYQRAYSSENSVRLAQDLGKLYGVDGFLSEVDGAPAAKRVAVMRRPAYRSYGTLLEDGQHWMALSLRHLQESVRLSAITWDQIKREDRSSSEVYWFDTSFARSFERTSDLSIANMLAMVEGPAQIRSALTGETVTVDLPAFYRNPPQDLKSFLPTAFENSGEWKQLSLQTADGKVQNVRYRNYDQGRGTDWSLPSYRQIFPGLQNSQDVPKSVRVLSESWGTGIAALPLAGVL